MAFFAALAPAFSVIGSLVGAAGTIFSGISAMQQANYQAKVAAMNQQIANDNAKRAIEVGQINQQGQDTQTAAMLGEQEAVQGASGLSLTGKSQILTRKAARELGRLDALNVRQAAEIESYNYKTQAMNFGAQAAAAKMQGQGALLSSFFGAGSSLMSSLGKVKSANKYGSGSAIL